MKELAQNYFLEKGFNCSESVLLAANDTYNLGIDGADISLISGFGGGMGCGKTCGALCGAMAALGKAKVEGSAHTTAGLRDVCGKLTMDFEDQFGSIECKVLKAKYFTPETRCAVLVGATAELLSTALDESK